MARDAVGCISFIGEVVKLLSTDGNAYCSMLLVIQSHSTRSNALEFEGCDMLLAQPFVVGVVE